MANRYDIFLSYRRSEGKDIARAIKETLERRGYHVFLDMDELQDGVFDKRILDAIQSAPIYLILLTEHCLDRCDKPTDWVRQEIDYALRHHKQIIPINPDKQFIGFADNVPAHIQAGLSQHQYSAIDTGQLYQVSMHQLITRRLEPVFRRRRIRLGLWLALLSVLFGVGGYMIYSHHQQQQPQLFYEQACYYNHVGEPTYNRDSAMHYLHLAAEADYAPAQRDLGLLYQFSIDLDNHAALSFYWFNRAYANGDPLACALLGYSYEHGIGTPFDMVQAINLYHEGMDHGDAYACYLLGQCLCEGKGLAQDVVEGTRLIARSAQMGDAWGQLYMRKSGQWVFSPAVDSISSPYLKLRAVCMTDTSTTLYLRWNNEEYVGGWMQISPQAALLDAQHDLRFPVRNLMNCRYAPDTTQVAWGTSHDFALLFAALPDSVHSVHFFESDTSQWKIYGLRLQ